MLRGRLCHEGGPLSNLKIISLLNRYFVPVYAVNEDYRKGGPKPPEEKAEYNRIYKESLAAKLSTGTVHVYLLTPDGHPCDSLHVAEGSRTDRLTNLLEKWVAKLNVPEGKPLVEPGAQSRPPVTDRESIVLHLAARSLDGRGAWSEFPVENWIVLTRSEAEKLLSPGASQVNTSGEIDKIVSEKILKYFYPATENNDVSKNEFDHLSLRGEIDSAKGKNIRVRITEAFKMKHWFYHKPDQNQVEAVVTGYVDFDKEYRAPTGPRFARRLYPVARRHRFFQTPYVLPNAARTDCRRNLRRSVRIWLLRFFASF